MERNVSLNEISDGKLYGLNDLVKADCNDCKGCFACCQGMGISIILDPLDIYRLLTNLNNSFEELLVDKIELNIQKGIIMPNLKMIGTSERCSFLNSEGRCSIHAFRPGICRLFPLGRCYENHAFQYFLQVNECKKKNKTKIKVRKWIDTPDIKDNERFVIDWHYFLKDLQDVVKSTQDDNLIKDINMYLLKHFYIMPYDANTDFYLQFNERLSRAKEFIEASIGRTI
ncbi:MAG: YkgJ family cysteine cluster protein [Mobilitalea sp.]